MSRLETYHVLHLANQIDRIVDRHQIGVISAYHVLPSGLAAALVAHRRHVPFAVTVFGEVYSDTELFAAKRRLTDFTLRTAHATWSVSRHCAEGARRRGYPTDVTYFGVSLSRFSGTLSPGAPAFLRSTRGPVVGYVARMEEEMGLAVLLDAVPLILGAMPDASVIVAGRHGQLTADAERVASRYPGRVRVVVDPPNQTVADVYAASTVVAVPSTNQRACLGLAIAEASSSGTPVVVSDVGGGPEILGPGAGLLVPPRDSHALADALLSYMRDPAACQRAGSAGRSFIKAHFDEEARNRDIADKILALAAGHGNQPA